MRGVLPTKPAWAYGCGWEPSARFVKPTQFELELQRLGLNGDDLKLLQQSERLKAWARRHRSSRYIPEHLLAAWRLDVFEVDVNLTKSDRPA